MSRARLAFVRGKEGFSLIEVILVMVLVGILAAILIPPLNLGVQGYSSIETRGHLAAQAREAATRMVRELRNIQKEGDNTPNITSADASSITFVDVSDNTITFALSGPAVNRNADTLVDNVSSLQFRYFDGSNTELTSLPLSGADRDSVRRILVVLMLAEGSEIISLTDQAYLQGLTGY